MGCRNEYHKLNNYVESKYFKNKKKFVLINEVQMCEGFEKTINKKAVKRRKSGQRGGSLVIEYWRKI